MLGRSRTAAAIAAAAITATLALAPSALARDDSITSFDGTNIVLSFFPAAGLAPGAKAPTVLFGPGWSSGRTTDENSATDTSGGAIGVGPLRMAGYNVLTWDPRGFGSSGGTVTVDSPDNEARR
jgi:ABC-2 type transport system ATP-binding protein